jgi:hypothetical protein
MMIRRVAAAALLSIAAASWIEESVADAPRQVPPFNAMVLATLAEYAARDRGGYAWPARAGTHGTTRDLWLGRVRLARAGSGTHCVGVTLEVLWRTLEKLPGGPAGQGLTARSADRLRRLWFVPVAGGMGAAEALPALGLGRRIESLEDVRPGDFVQVWAGEWGHSMIFLEWVRDDRGAITGLRYWSSQPWTDGMGVSEMAVGSSEGAVEPAHIFVGRAEPARRPRARRRAPRP